MFYDVFNCPQWLVLVVQYMVKYSQTFLSRASVMSVLFCCNFCCRNTQVDAEYSLLAHWSHLERDYYFPVLVSVCNSELHKLVFIVIFHCLSQSNFLQPSAVLILWFCITFQSLLAIFIILYIDFYHYTVSLLKHSHMQLWTAIFLTLVSLPNSPNLIFLVFLMFMQHRQIALFLIHSIYNAYKHKSNYIIIMLICNNILRKAELSRRRKRNYFFLI